MAKIIATILAAVVLTLLVFMSKKDTTPVAQIAGPLSSTQAIEKVKNRPEVKKYLSEIPAARVDLNGTDDDFYLIQVYEIKDGHTATFNWYQVNKKTGTVKAEFEVPEEIPLLNQTYTDSRVKFSYPTGWQQNRNTRVFENGDMITVEKIGPTQKSQTDFSDGARFTVAQPLATNLDLESWVAQNFSGRKETKITIGTREFVTTTDGYYFIKVKGQIFGFFLFAGGENRKNNSTVLQEILESVFLK